ncbi:MAG: NUDIX domain-containing protein [Flammeovirgaceae bacterium]
MKFFVNDIPFVVEEAKPFSTPVFSKDMATFSHPSISQIMRLYDLAKNGQVLGHRGMIFLMGNYTQAVNDIKSHFKLIEAAGGIVKKEDKLLFIKRFGKWDLPKGKIEKGEKKKEAAVREVEEECGIRVSLINKIGETWHTYPHKGNEVLKCTHWYAMDCLDDRNLSPQTEEGIEALQWFSLSEAKAIALKDTYNSIRDIYNQYMDAQ